MSRIAIVDGIRTPFCKMGTSFNDLSAQELGRLAARELFERTGFDPAKLDEVIFGCVGQPADAANIARVIALLAGVPKEVPAYTVHRKCRNLIAHGLAATRWQQSERIDAVEHGADDVFLQRSELRVAPMFAEDVVDGQGNEKLKTKN